MPTKKSAAEKQEPIEVNEEKAPVNSPKAVTKKGLTVYEAWGQAFAAYGTKKDAPEQITKFMENAFPGRKTLWAKWVNPVRARYNAGKLPGVPAPAEKIRVYAFEDAPKRVGKERRTKETTKPVAKKKAAFKAPAKSKKK